jgi:hypothetical protein
MPRPNLSLLVPPHLGQQLERVRVRGPCPPPGRPEVSLSAKPTFAANVRQVSPNLDRPDCQLLGISGRTPLLTRTKTSFSLRVKCGSPSPWTTRPDVRDLPLLFGPLISCSIPTSTARKTLAFPRFTQQLAEAVSTVYIFPLSVVEVGPLGDEVDGSFEDVSFLMGPRR